MQWIVSMLEMLQRMGPPLDDKLFPVHWVGIKKSPSGGRDFFFFFFLID